ncbi:MAG: hypothetical protein HYW07_15085 [Candidatus Latescibacteria bacterium]|nr:hypothetical protein [Candidatus Latescibacterota bacterium]
MAMHVQTATQRWKSIAGIALLLSVLSPGQPLAHPIIQEVLYDGPGTDADDVFTEIAGPPGDSLDGWTLIGINGGDGAIYRTVNLTGAVIPVDGVLVIATSVAVGDLLAQRDFVGEVDWQNGPDAVQLRDPQGNIVDALQYGDAGIFNAGEGAPAATVPAGQSLSRDSAGTDTDNNSADFAPLDPPTPGIGPVTGPPAGPTGLVVSVPDTAAKYGYSLVIPVRLAGPHEPSIAALEVFLSFDGDLLSADSTVVPAAPTPDWTLATNVTQGIGTSIDTLKVVMAASGELLAGTDTLFCVRFAVADHRRPGRSPLGLEHVLFNAGAPACQVVHGAFVVTGTNGALTIHPEPVVPPAVLEVQVTDADEDRDPASQDRVAVRIAAGAQTEVLALVETGASTGVFTGSISTLIAAPVPGNGELEIAPGTVLAVCYDDSLDAAGHTTARCASTQVSGGRDGRLDASVVVQPGDSLRVRLVDPDLNADPGLQETVVATASNGATGDSAAITLVEVSTDDSVFFGCLATTLASGGSGDSALTIARADTLQVIYADAQTASGSPGEVRDTCLVVGLFGDVDADGLVLAFDASKVLAHVLSPALAGLDSLAANLDSLAPESAITPYDAALILQHRVGLRRYFPVQEPGAHNHPQPATAPAAARSAPGERFLALRTEDRYLSIWLSERADIVAGDLVIEGLASPLAVESGLPGFLVAWHTGSEGLRIALAGAVPLSGPGDLVRIYPAENWRAARLTRAQFNDGQVRAAEAAIALATVPADFALHPNFPNPFNPQTTIRFDLPYDSEVELQVLDLLGQQVRSLVSAHLPAGAHHVVWDGCDARGMSAGSSLFFYRLKAGSFNQTRSMLLVR